MATVEEAMDEWGRDYLRDYGYEVAEDASISYKDDIQYTGGCETCSYDEYVVRVSDGNVTATFYGGLDDLLRMMNEGVE